MARTAFLTGQDWHSTIIHKQYLSILPKETKPLGYRRVSELLTELENTGLVVSQTGSKGRHGYGTQYKLVVPPEAVGKTAFAEWWENLVKIKREHDEKIKREKMMPKSKKFSPFGDLYGMLKSESEEDWQKFVGLD